MNDKAKLSQMTSIIKLFELKRDYFKNNIYKINQLIDKKNASIQTLQHYAISYADKMDDFILSTIPIIRNNQLFYAHLQEVIRSEKKELDKLNKIKLDLIKNYNDFDKKISGLTTLCDGIVQSERAAADKAEDAANFDLTITRMGIEING